MTDAGSATAPRRRSERVRNRIGLATSPLLDVYQRLRVHPRLDALYPEYLVRTHMIIRASVPLMQVALERARALPHDPLASPLATYLDAHIGEEAAHDEWVLDDLAELGLDRSSVLASMPPPAVAAMVGAQYYWVAHHHPVALLGYIVVLEGYPARSEDIEEMIERSGLPSAAFRTWNKHADLDPHHNRDLDDLLDSLPLTSDDVSCICVSGMTTVRFAVAAFDELFEGDERAAQA